MRRGEVRLVDLDPARGSEASKRRPAVVVSNDRANAAAARANTRAEAARRCRAEAADVETEGSRRKACDAEARGTRDLDGTGAARTGIAPAAVAARFGRDVATRADQLEQCTERDG